MAKKRKTMEEQYFIVSQKFSGSVSFARRFEGPRTDFYNRFFFDDSAAAEHNVVEGPIPERVRTHTGAGKQCTNTSKLNTQQQRGRQVTKARTLPIR